MANSPHELNPGSHVLIIGCGYVGQRVAKRHIAIGDRVTALVRSPTAATALRQQGLHTLIGDLDEPATLRDLPQTDLIHYFAPPPSQGETDPRITRFLEALFPDRLPRHMVYISTTGVYGDCGGAWVDEERPPNPTADRARRRLFAERTLQQFGADHCVDIVILRVPGIYGSGRLPDERIAKGTPVLREDESPFSNRIHVDDLVQACLAAATRGQAGAVYNVCDGHPTTMTDYFYRVADLLGLPRPPALNLSDAQAQLSPAMLSYLKESRRPSNRKMREELGIRLRYPTLAQGLPACLPRKET